MTTEVIRITSREQWLQARTKDITSTEVSALYGLSPYKSEFELFHEKRDGKVVTIQQNERMKWGNRLEDAIAYGAAEDMGWNIAHFSDYIRDPEIRIGSSFDFKILSDIGKGHGILEVKNVDWLAYQRNWEDDGEGNIEGPAHIELQVQHQLEVTGLEWAAIVVLVGGNEQKIVLRNRDREIGQDIRRRVAAFWQSVADNRPPSPDYVKDAEFIIKQLRNNANDGEVMEADAEIDDLLKQYAFLSREYSDLGKLKDQAKATILQRIGTASKVVASSGNLSCGMVKGSEGTLITPEMVGTYYGARAGYRAFRFTKKEK